jgi:hypothetical protein
MTMAINFAFAFFFSIPLFSSLRLFVLSERARKEKKPRKEIRKPKAKLALDSDKAFREIGGDLSNHLN